MKKIYIILILLILILGACGLVKQPAKGASDKVIVISSQEMQDTLQSTIDDCFSYGIRTPEFQQYFYTQWQRIKDFEYFSEFKNVIFLVNLADQGRGRNILRSMLPEKKFNLALEDSVHIFSLDDPFAKDQIMLVVAGTDIEQMRSNIKQQKDWIYSKVDKNYIRFASNHIYGQYERRSKTKYLWSQYQWTFRVPDNYKILKEKENFVWLGRSNPYRWISFYWEEGFQTRLMNIDELLKQRNQLGAWYDSVGTDTTTLGFYYTKFNGRDALKMYGLWYHEKETKGGPFASYAFYDEKTNRTFIVDYLLYYPGHRVTNLFRQLDIIVKTFTTEYK